MQILLLVDWNSMYALCPLGLHMYSFVKCIGPGSIIISKSYFHQVGDILRVYIS